MRDFKCLKTLYAEVLSHEAYNLGLEKRRLKARVSEMPGAIQLQIAQDYMGDLDKRIHRLAATGLPEYATKNVAVMNKETA